MAAKFKKGDMLICINNKALESVLTVGKEYLCLSCSNCTSTCIVRNDIGRKDSYADTRFKIKVI